MKFPRTAHILKGRQDAAPYASVFFLLVLFAYSILSWLTYSGRLDYDSPVIKVQRVLARICEPVLRPVRKVIPPVQVGGVGLDLSVLIVFVVVAVLNNTVFNWLLALSGLSSIFSWGSINLAKIRFRRAWAKSGRDAVESSIVGMRGIDERMGFIAERIVKASRWLQWLATSTNDPLPGKFSLPTICKR